MKPGIPRRQALQLFAATAVATLAAAPRRAQAAKPYRLFPAIGITGKVDQASDFAKAGADFLVETVADFLVPLKSEAEFAANRRLARKSPLRIRGCNSFLRDPSLVCVGPKADHALVLAYTETACARLRAIGGEYIVFGSNSARRIPDGWPRAQAEQQFIALLRGMAPIAARHRITIGVEMQRREECNFLNFIDEVVRVVAPVNHPNIRVLADLYHMRVMEDSPEKLAGALPWVGMVELAEREARTLPGVAGDDFRPYFRVLAQGKFPGLLDIEGSGTAEELKRAFQTMRAQADDAAIPA